MREFNCLERLYFEEKEEHRGVGEIDVRYLLNKTDKDLLLIKNLGSKSLANIKKALDKHYLKIRETQASKNVFTIKCPTCSTELPYAVNIIKGISS